MLRLVAILGIVALIGIVNMAPGHEGGGGAPPPDGGGAPPPDGGGAPPPDGGGAPPPGGGGAPHPDGGGHLGGPSGPGATVGSFTGPGTTVGSFAGPGTTVGSFTGPGTTVGSFTGPGTTVGSFTGPGTTVGSFTGVEGGSFPGGAQLFGEHGAPAGFQFGSFSGPGGAFPGGGATVGAFPGGGATVGGFPGGGATVGGFPSFAGFSFSGSGGPGLLGPGPEGAFGPGGPAPQIAELGLYGNFGVIGEQLEGGAVGNYGLLDQSGHVLDVSGFGKGFGDFFNRSDSALAAQGQFAGLKPEDISTLGGGFAAEQLGKLDFLGFHAMDPAVVAAMFQNAAGPGGQVGPIGPGGPGPGGLGLGGLQLNPEQWAGAFGAMKPEDIRGLGGVVGDAVGSLGSKDFQAIPPDQVLAMLQGTVLNFDPQAGGGLQQNLQQYSGKLDGMLGAMNFDQYKEIDPGAMLGMMQAMNLGGEGFDLSKTELRGNDVASMFGALDQQRLGEFGGDKVLGSIKDLQKADFVNLDAKGALNIFNTVGSDKALSLANLGGIVGRFDAAGFKDVGNQPTFDIVKALEARDFEALDKAAAFGACTILDHSQLTEVQVNNLIGLFSSVGEGASNLPTEHVGAYLKSFGGEDVASLGQDAAGNLVGAAGDADLQSLPPDVQGAYLSTLAADRLGAGAAGFGAAGAGDTVFNILPAGAYSGKSLSEVIGGAAGAPILFGGKLFGGSSP